MAKRRGAQPGQIGRVRFKDLDTTGEPNKNILVADGLGGTRAATPAEIVGATQLDELADVGTAAETNGFILGADGTKYDGKTPDAAGVVSKFDDQTIAGSKTFTSDTKLTSVTPQVGGVLPVSGRVSGSPGAAGIDFVTRAQLLASGTSFTLGNVNDPRNPDFNTLNDALDAATIKGGGTILILDNDDYQATGIDGTSRDTRNVTIVGERPQSDISIRKPIVSLVYDAGYTAVASVGLLAVGSVTIIGCRIPIRGIRTSFTSSQPLLVKLDECTLTVEDPFSDSAGAGADEGCVELVNVSDAVVTLNDFTQDPAFRGNANKYAVTISSAGFNTVRLHRIRPLFVADAVPAVLRTIFTTATLAQNLYHDDTVSTINAGSGTVISLLVNPPDTTIAARPFAIANHVLEIGIASPTDIKIPSSLACTAYDSPLSGVTPTSKFAPLRVLAGGLTISGTAAPGPLGVDVVGIVPNQLNPNVFYFVWLIGDSTGVLSPTAIISLSQFAPSFANLPGYDIFRYLGSSLTTGTFVFVEAFNQDFLTLYSTTQNFTSLVPSTIWALFSLVALVPSTSSRILLNSTASVGDNAVSSNSFFAANPAVEPIGGSTGGIQINFIAGQTGFGRQGADVNRTEMDIALSAILLRESGSGQGFTAGIDGYFERVR